MSKCYEYNKVVDCNKKDCVDYNDSYDLNCTNANSFHCLSCNNIRFKSSFPKGDYMTIEKYQEHNLDLIKENKRLTDENNKLRQRNKDLKKSQVIVHRQNSFKFDRGC